ncbi:single-stranded DNA-binding protein [Escherichia coli]|nr:single-stranded DNA-binding protein [Escherichia coli]PRO96903.1 hypothetical protein C6X66_24295 [Escherichia coli]PTO13302.1 single-stranded DNA-binding protein [Escherichia coli]
MYLERPHVPYPTRLGKDPEVRYIPNGGAVANLQVATSESWRDKQTGEMREQTEWHRVVLFGKLAEVAGEYLTRKSLCEIRYRDGYREVAAFMAYESGK